MYRSKISTWAPPLALLLALGCGDGTDDPDAAIPDAATPDSMVVDLCARNEDCDDGVRCTGVEMCRLGDPDADARGCVVLEPCMSGQVCDAETDRCVTDCAVTRDADGDGSVAIECGGDDCDDSDSGARPGLPEMCDSAGRNEDCDDLTLGVDADGDGFIADRCCNIIRSGEMVCGDDCNDASIAVNPEAEEICDLLGDNDCDPTTHPFDLDEDGFDQISCGGVDCLDDEPSAYPGAPELCDGIDNDCSNGGIDDEDVDDDEHVAVGASCTGGPFPVDDCDDTEPLAFGSADEVCDGVDNDCDDATDEEPDATASCSAADATMECVDGACGLLACDEGFADCDRDPDNGCEQPLDVDGACGRCGVTCGVAATCDDGLCSAVVQVVAAADSACALRSNGRVACWGNNDQGQLGAGSTLAASGAPLEVAGVSTAVSLSAGVDHYCALLEDETAVCWGDNEHGQVGNDATGGFESTPVPVVSPDGSGRLTMIAELGLGDRHGCARRTDGSVWCWGDGAFGQLGGGDTADSTRPLRVLAPGTGSSALTSATLLESGTTHTCARRSSHPYMVCWGANAQGQLGDGTTTQRVRPVWGSINGFWPDIVSIGAGSSHTCATRANGSVYCWGRDLSGELGDGTPLTSDSTPGLITAPSLTEGSALTEVSTGFIYNCARSAPARRIYCWGDPSGFASSAAVVPAPVWTRQLDDVSEDGAALGFQFACVLRDTGQVTCWGRNTEGQLGRGTIGGESDMLGNVDGLGSYIDVDTGSSHSCMVRDSGEVGCFGSNSNGALGGGDLFDTRSQSDINGSGVRHARAVCSGQSWNCARVAGGAVRCWGISMGGFIRTFDEPSTELGGIADARDLAAGQWHGCAALASGDVACFGLNDDGQIGDGTTTRREDPVTITVPGDAVQVAAGRAHSCARVRTGEVYCWGDDSFGQLGNDAATADALTPQPVEGIGAAVDIAAGDDHTCARLVFGEVRCWGRAGSGRLGNDATSPDQPTPVTVSGTTTTLTDFVELWAGAAHTCARRADGSTYCWGLNASGQLGVGDTSARDEPTQVTGSLSATSGGGGTAHTCVTTDLGGIACWGDEGSGRLGNGSFSGTETSPVLTSLTP